MHDVVVKKFTFAISSPDEFLVFQNYNNCALFCLNFTVEINTNRVYSLRDVMQSVLTERQWLDDVTWLVGRKSLPAL